MNVYGAYHAVCEVVPGILEKDWGVIEKKIGTAKSFAKSLHVDLIDGKFSENMTFADPSPFEKYSKDFILELHMMTDDPLQYLKPFAKFGFRRFIGHVERMPDVPRFVADAQLLGEAVLGIDADTPIEKLTVNLDDVDAVLVMTVKAGYSGQKFMPEMLEKVRKLRARAPELAIEVDGGITEETALVAKDAGATRFVATSFIFDSEDPKARYENLLRLIS